jgi:chloramphenicol 3-O-phosphotransferase
VHSPELPCRVVFLNGTSSSGKTTLARAIQDESDIPFVYWGIDTLFGLVLDTTTGTPAELARAVLRRERTVLG